MKSQPLNRSCSDVLRVFNVCLLSYLMLLRHSLIQRSLLRTKLWLVLSLAGCLLLVTHDSSKAARSKARITVHAAGKGGQHLRLQDGRQLQVEYRGAQNVTEALRAGEAHPRSLASIVLANDAVPDLIAGYSYNGMGIVTVQNGNPDAFAPKDDSVFVRMQQGYNPDSLMPVADTYLVPESPDFLQVGDFNHDNRKDALVAARGGDLFLLAGDGRGSLEAPEQIPLPGGVTAMAAGEFRAADGWTNVAIAVDGPSGPALLIYDGVDGLQGAPLSFPLNAPATAVQIAALDNDSFMDVAVAAGSEIDIIHGWGRKQSVNLQSRVERINLNSSARDLAVGFFIWNRQGSNQIAVLSDDGTIKILDQAGSDTRPFSAEEIALFRTGRLNAKKQTVDVESLSGWQPNKTATWNTAREFATNSSLAADAVSQSVLLRSHISFHETDDLLMLDAGQHKLDIVRQIDAKARVQTEALSGTNDLAIVSLDAAAAPAAVLALPQKLNGEHSVVVLQPQNSQPTIVPIVPTATITVDRTDDPSGAGLTAASACTGAANDCSLRGAVQFANANAGTTISIPAGTYTLAINGTGAGGCEGNTVGDLGINQSTTITGAGSATTIIRQHGTGPSNNGDRVMCLNEAFAINLIYNFSGITVTGGRDSNTLFGGAGIIGGELGNSLTLTDVVVSNNQVVGTNVNGGGGIQITGGSLTITNSTIGGTNAPGLSSDRDTVANANSESASGGGVSFNPSAPFHDAAVGNFTATGTTFNHNTAASGAAGGGGFDLFNLSYNGHSAGTGTASFNTCTFSNNAATGGGSGGTGGAIMIEALSATVGTGAGTTSFTSNSATNRGGGIYVGGGTGLTLDGTTATLTFSSNSATVGGSSVSTAALTTAKGTNLAIGGDIEVTTNGTWTNTNGVGTSISPTNVVIAGGTWNSNDSTTNVSGNFTFNTGTFNANTGTFNFNGSGTQSINGPTSPAFNNLTDSNTTQPLTANVSLSVSGTLNVNGANAIFDPVAAAVISGAGTLTGTGTARVRRTAATADFSSQYTITNKTLTNLTVEYIGAAAQTGNALTYGGLKINNASGVTLAAGTTTVNGTLTLTSGALAVGANTLVINNGTTVGSGSLTSGVTGTVNYNQGSSGQSVIAANYGNLTFSAFTKVLASSGTIGIAGTFNTGGVATGHTIAGSTVDFNGTGAQTVPAFNFNNLTISGARTTNSVTLVNGGTIGVAATFSPTATFSTGNFIITNNTMDFNGTGAQSVATFNYNNLTISGNRGGATVTLGAGTIGIAGVFTPSATNVVYSLAGNTVEYNGSGTPQSLPASFTTYNNLTLNNSAGTMGFSGLTVQGVIEIKAGTFTSASTYTNVLIDVGTTLAGINATTINVSGNWTNNGTFTPNGNTVNFNGNNNAQTITGATTFDNFQLSHTGTGGVTLANNILVNLSATFTSGTLTTNANTFSMAAGAMRSQTTGYIIGNEKKTFGDNGPFTYDLGTANGYSPVDVNVTAGTGDFTVKATQGPQPNVNAATSLQRYWTLTATGFTANLVFHYLDPDVMGNESAYDIIRVSAGTPVSFPNNCPLGPCVNSLNNTGSINGVMNFSDWTLGQQAAPTATNGDVSGRILDTSGNPIAGTAIRLSGTQNRLTITDASGNYRFDSVETTGFYTVTPSRANYTFSPAQRSFSQLGQHTDAAFTAAVNGGTLINPLDTTEFFVRQQYLDFLNREPEEAGFTSWVNGINNCAAGDTSCDHVHVSEMFLRSEEFQERGYYIYRFYSTAFGRKPDYAEFTPDMAQVSGFLTETHLEAAKTQFVTDFMTRPAFVTKYGALSNAAYVDALINTAQVSLSNRQTIIDALNNGAINRAQALRIIAESGEVYQKYYNQAFVVMEYFGYLRRDPDALYLNWIEVLNQTGDPRHMVEGFVNSSEYRNRFRQ